jgi:hypothetical protein
MRRHAWSLLGGPALGHTVHQTSATILRYVGSHPGDSPKEISEATDLTITVARQTCARMEWRGNGWNLQSLSAGNGTPVELWQRWPLGTCFLKIFLVIAMQAMT